MSFRFLHLADLHLETAFGGRAETRDRLREATLEAWTRALEVAEEERVHALLLAGDVYDDPLLAPRVELQLVDGVRRLAQAGIWVLWACGNHDPGGKRAKELGLEGDEPWQERVHLFRTARPRAVTVLDGEGREVGVVVGVGHSRDRVTDDLVAKCPPQATDLPVVGLVHTQVQSARSGEGHEPYAPSTRESFAQARYDHWALGHVHLRQRVFPDLPVWYAGNLCGRNPRETGAKGGLLVELEAGRETQPRFVPLAPTRWEQVTVSGLEQATHARALVDLLLSAVERARAGCEEELLLRLVPTGPCPLAADLLHEDRRDELEEELRERSGLLELQLRPERLHRPRDLDALRRTPSVLAEALSLLEQAAQDPAELLGLTADVRLAGLPVDAEPDARRARVVELLAGLEEELLSRGLDEGAEA